MGLAILLSAIKCLDMILGILFIHDAHVAVTVQGITYLGGPLSGQEIMVDGNLGEYSDKEMTALGFTCEDMMEEAKALLFTILSQERDDGEERPIDPQLAMEDDLEAPELDFTGG